MTNINDINTGEYQQYITNSIAHCIYIDYNKDALKCANVIQSNKEQNKNK